MIYALAWVLLALPGLVYASLGYIEARKDREALLPAGNGRMYIANAQVRNQSIRALICGIWIGVGIAAIYSGQDIPQLTPGLLALYLTNGLMSLKSYLDWRDGVKLRAAR